MVFIILFLLAVLLLPAPLLLRYNRLRAFQDELDSLASDIEVLIQRRWAVLRSLMLILGPSQAWEAEVLQRVADVRPGHAVQALQEAYPRLRSVADFAQLQAQLIEIETDIARARQAYNRAVQRFNVTISRFPEVLIAQHILGFRRRPYFTAEDPALPGSAPPPQLAGP